MHATHFHGFMVCCGEMMRWYVVFAWMCAGGDGGVDVNIDGE